LRLKDDYIASELRTLDVSPLSPRQFDSPFVPPGKGKMALQRQAEALARVARDAIDTHSGSER
jgi:hypothetical protein